MLSMVRNSKRTPISYAYRSTPSGATPSYLFCGVGAERDTRFATGSVLHHTDCACRHSNSGNFHIVVALRFLDGRYHHSHGSWETAINSTGKNTGPLYFWPFRRRIRSGLLPGNIRKGSSEGS